MQIKGFIFLSEDILVIKDGSRERLFKKESDCETPSDIESISFMLDYVAVNPGYVKFLEIDNIKEEVGKINDR